MLRLQSIQGVCVLCEGFDVQVSSVTQVEAHSYQRKRSQVLRWQVFCSGVWCEQ